MWGAEAAAFYPTFLPGPEEVLTAPADQDFPSCTCCHSCIGMFVLTVVFLNVKIRSHQTINAKAGTFSQLYSTVKVAWLFVLVLARKQYFSTENEKKRRCCILH